MKTISEQQLVIPALIVLSQQEDIITNKSLKEGILKIIKPGKEDLKSLNNRKLTFINNKIDNLISHRKLEKYVTHTKVSSKIYLKINDKGKTLLSKRMLGLVA
ncbi:hypothetical protein HOK00_06885 [bacterium]|nr:hypothetical protein [bacterium]